MVNFECVILSWITHLVVVVYKPTDKIRIIAMKKLINLFKIPKFCIEDLYKSTQKKIDIDRNGQSLIAMKVLLLHWIKTLPHDVYLYLLTTYRFPHKHYTSTKAYKALFEVHFIMSFCNATVPDIQIRGIM